MCVSNQCIAEFCTFLVIIKMATSWMWSSGTCIFMQHYVSKIHHVVCVCSSFLLIAYHRDLFSHNIIVSESLRLCSYSPFMFNGA